MKRVYEGVWTSCVKIDSKILEGKLGQVQWWKLSVKAKLSRKYNNQGIRNKGRDRYWKKYPGPADEKASADNIKEDNLTYNTTFLKIEKDRIFLSRYNKRLSNNRCS